MVPSAKHRVHGIRQKAYRRVALQSGIEIEARGNAEAAERGAQDRDVGLRRPDDNAHLAKRPAGRGLLQNPPRDLRRLTLDGRSAEQRQGGVGALAAKTGLRGDVSEPGLHGSGPIRIRQRESDVRMAIQRGDDAEFGIGQGVKTIEANGPNAAQAVAFDLIGGQFQAFGAQGHAALFQLQVHLAIHGQKRGGQRRIRQAFGQAGAVATGRGELGDGPRHGGAEARQTRHAGELPPIGALHGLFDDQVKGGVGSLANAAGPSLDESVDRLNQLVAEHEAFPRDAVLQVPRHGCGRHKQADGFVSRAESLAEAVQDEGCLARPSRSR